MDFENNKDKNSYEHNYSNEQSIFQYVKLSRKIKVFISSICGVEKYDNVRANLKKAIEDTQIADVYTFESEGASSLPAGSHYRLALEDSDICIFLIDNADGVTPGVQNEIDTVKKNSIKSLFYFCDENLKEKTVLEKSLMGAKFAKSTTVHNFKDLNIDGAKALINEIITIYHYYCQGKFTLLDESKEVTNIHVSNVEYIAQSIVPKTVLNNINKCKNYILKFTTGYSNINFNQNEEKINEIDEWGEQFLYVLFEAKSIKHFNLGMYMNILKELQTDAYYQVVRLRWYAIQEYFTGNVEKCVKLLNDALENASKSNQPIWLIKDILVDIRNQEMVLNQMNNSYAEPSAQKELTNSSEELYYPVLDRIHSSLHKKYINGLYKLEIESPYTITLGNNLDSYGDLLASLYIIAFYNGSLTHLLLFYEEIKDFLFYLSNKYSNWTFRRDMLKLAIYTGKKKEINGIIDSYPEILNNLESKDATNIMEFCNNHQIDYRQFNSQLLAFGSVGYYLDDEQFKKYESLIIYKIKEWLNSKSPIIAVGQNIFKCLSEVSLRLSHDDLSEICCSFIDKHYIRYYRELFNFIENNINLEKMSKASAVNLIEHINKIFENENEFNEIKLSPNFLCTIRKQSRILTESLERKISKLLPTFYNSTYKLETTKNKAKDYPQLVQYYIQSIQDSNARQGENGTYFGHFTREIAILRNILLETKINIKLIDLIVSTLADTLLVSKEDIDIKLDAICLLICIIIKYPDGFKRNYNIFEQIYNEKEKIEEGDYPSLICNVDIISLKIGLQFLYSAMGCNTYSNILELMPYIQDDIVTTISVENVIIKYLELDDNITFPNGIETIVLHNALQWIHSDNLKIRWCATRILFMLLRNPENTGIINNQLINMVDSDNLYIKNLIMRNIYTTKGILESTKDYIMSRCQNDANFVVKMVYEEEINKHIHKRL